MNNCVKTAKLLVNVLKYNTCCKREISTAFPDRTLCVAFWASMPKVGGDCLPIGNKRLPGR